MIEFLATWVATVAYGNFCVWLGYRAHARRQRRYG